MPDTVRNTRRGARGRTDGAPPPDGTQPAKRDGEPKPLGQEAPEVLDDATKIGEKRLDRSSTTIAIAAFIGGMSLSFGAVAMAWSAASAGGEVIEPSAARLAGALAYPIGLVILLIGKSDLFTENFLLPVTGVLEGNGSVRSLGELWIVTLTANLAGALVFAWLIARTDLLASGPAEQVISLADHTIAAPFWTVLVRAVFAGWLMTILTWLLLAAEGIGPRLFLIWTIATLLILGGFNHVVISASEIFIAMFLDAEITVSDWLTRNFAPSLIGNLVGGVVFVTLLHYAQAVSERQNNGDG